MAEATPLWKWANGEDALAFALPQVARAAKEGGIVVGDEAKGDFAHQGAVGALGGKGLGKAQGHKTGGYRAGGPPIR